MRKAYWIAAVGLSVLAIAAYPVMAHCGHCLDSAKEYWKAMSDGKLTLAQAVQTAEASGKGKALSAVPHKHQDGQIHLHVYLLDGDKLTLAMVDTKTSKVVKTEDVKELWHHSADHDHAKDKAPEKDKPKTKPEKP